MKKNYVSPLLSVMQIENTICILAASGHSHDIEGLDDIDVSSQQWGGGAALSRGNRFLWDDDEE